MEPVDPSPSELTCTEEALPPPSNNTDTHAGPAAEAATTSPRAGSGGGGGGSAPPGPVVVRISTSLLPASVVKRLGMSGGIESTHVPAIGESGAVAAGAPALYDAPLDLGGGGRVRKAKVVTSM